MKHYLVSAPRWYWSDDLHTYVCMTDDGLLTTEELGERIARGGDPVTDAELWLLTANFWVMAAETLQEYPVRTLVAA